MSEIKTIDDLIRYYYNLRDKWLKYRDDTKYSEGDFRYCAAKVGAFSEFILLLEQLKQTDSVTQADAKILEIAPTNSLPSWEECALRVDNSDWFAKRGEDPKITADQDGKFASELHHFIYEYSDIDDYKNSWFLHRLEKLLIEVKLQVCGRLSERAKKDREMLIKLSIPEREHKDLLSIVRHTEAGFFGIAERIACIIRKHIEENP